MKEKQEEKGPLKPSFLKMITRSKDFKSFENIYSQQPEEININLEKQDKFSDN